MLIKSFGQFWLPELVNWGSRGRGQKGELKGKTKMNYRHQGQDRSKVVEFDFWDGTGFYALYDNYICVYVGKATNTKLGPRLRNHRSDHLAGRWDKFTFFGLSSLRQDGTLRVPGARQYTPDDIIDAIEAISIGLVNPPLNRRFESIKKAHEIIQSDANSVKVSSREAVQDIQDRLARLENALIPNDGD